MQLFKNYSAHTPITEKERLSIASFLYDHLEAYGDPIPDIRKAIDYVFDINNTPGGLIIVSWLGHEITGAVVVNKTGMSKYIPENILVYIATHKEHRGKGLGKKLMATAIEQTQGDIALHVEPDNPAKGLYEQMGFTNKYLEMRLKK